MLAAMRAILVGVLVLAGGCVYRVDPPFDGGSDAPVLCAVGDAPGGYDGGGINLCCNFGTPEHPVWSWAAIDGTAACGGCGNECGRDEACRDSACVPLE